MRWILLGVELVHRAPTVLLAVEASERVLGVPKLELGTRRDDALLALGRVDFDE
jgi:hypothetical protein